MAILASDRAGSASRRLRKQPTVAEVAFWKLVRGRQVDGHRFRRQAPLGPYVADFFCSELRLVVELDGGIHRLRSAADEARDAWMRDQGLVVLRFANETLLRNPNAVLDAIRAQGMRRADTPHPTGSAGHLPPQGGKETVCEIWFYHLERSSLDEVLPGLLDKTLGRGWRALVKGPAGRLEQIDPLLWTWRDDSFLAHGRADAPHAGRQPILLSETGENLNGAQALFILDGAEPGETQEYERCFIIFDGRDETALTAARARWRELKAAGASLAYWKQSPEGRWEKAA